MQALHFSHVTLNIRLSSRLHVYYRQSDTVISVWALLYMDEEKVDKSRCTAFIIRANMFSVYARPVRALSGAWTETARTQDDFEKIFFIKSSVRRPISEGIVRSPYGARRMSKQALRRLIKVYDYSKIVW